MKTTYIYTLCDPITEEVRYIGKSNSLKQRLYKHIKDHEKTNTHKNNWIKSLMSKGLRPIIKELDEVPSDSWQYFEIYWIEQFKQWGFNLTNSTNGGDGTEGYKHRKSSRERMRKSKLGVPLSEEHKKSISESLKETSKNNPDLYKNRERIIISKEGLYQKYITENLSQPKCAEYFKCSGKVIFNNLKKYGIEKDKSVWKKQCNNDYIQPTKTIIQYDKEMNFIKKWEGGLKEIEDELGINRSMISRVCNRQRNHSKGFIWRYESDVKN